MDMTDEEFDLYQARNRAAAGYRMNGYEQFADEVERGKHDECHLMRIARFLIETSPPHSEEFLEAWNEAARIDTSRAT